MSDATPSYEAMHQRVRRHNGPARNHTCVGCCVKRAGNWAYDHRDDQQVVNHKGLIYSLDIGRYIPLCLQCHRRFDAMFRPTPGTRSVKPVGWFDNAWI
jgi:hypothetical protein